MKKPFKLSPKAEELIAKMEAREAAKKKATEAAEEGAEFPHLKEPAPIIGMGPNPLDTLGKVGCGK